MDLGIEGRTALVFGGDSGIGWHTAKRLLDEGAIVVVSDSTRSASTRRPRASTRPRGGCTPSPPT